MEYSEQAFFCELGWAQLNVFLCFGIWHFKKFWYFLWAVFTWSVLFFKKTFAVQWRLFKFNSFNIRQSSSTYILLLFAVWKILHAWVCGRAPNWPWLILCLNSRLGLSATYILLCVTLAYCLGFPSCLSVRFTGADVKGGKKMHRVHKLFV